MITNAITTTTTTTTTTAAAAAAAAATTTTTTNNNNNNINKTKPARLVWRTIQPTHTTISVPVKAANKTSHDM